MAKNNIEGNRVLNGASGTIYINNVEMATLTDINIKIEVERKDIKWGLGYKSKITGIKGSGDFKLDKIDSFGISKIPNFIKGKETFLTITADLVDPDATGGQTERYTLNNVWLNNIDILTLTRGETLADSIEFGFDATEIDITDTIAV